MRQSVKLSRKFFIPSKRNSFVFDDEMAMAYLCIAFGVANKGNKAFTFIPNEMFGDDSIELSRYQTSQILNGMNKLYNMGYIVVKIGKYGYTIVANDSLFSKDCFTVNSDDILKIKNSTNKWFSSLHVYLTLLATMQGVCANTSFDTIATWLNINARQVSRYVKLLIDNKVITTYYLSEVNEYHAESQFLSYRGYTRVFIPYMYSRSEDEVIVRSNLYENYQTCVNNFFDELDKNS